LFNLNVPPTVATTATRASGLSRPANALGTSVQRSGQQGYTEIQFGSEDDIPADYDGEWAKLTFAVWRPSMELVHLVAQRRICLGALRASSAGGGVDYDGDALHRFAVFRPFQREWYIPGSRDGFVQTRFGLTGDIAAPADYDGRRT